MISTKTGERQDLHKAVFRVVSIIDTNVHERMRETEGQFNIYKARQQRRSRERTT